MVREDGVDPRDRVSDRSMPPDEQAVMIAAASAGQCAVRCAFRSASSRLRDTAIFAEVSRGRINLARAALWAANAARASAFQHDDDPTMACWTIHLSETEQRTGDHQQNDRLTWMLKSDHGSFSVML
jgi:hypothetical protein